MLTSYRPGESPQTYVTPASLAKAQLLGAGHTIALAGSALVAVSDSDGASWRTLEPPADSTGFRLHADGTVIALVTKYIGDPDGPPVSDTTELTADVDHPTWRAVGVITGVPLDEELLYSTETDKFWGCGGSEKIVEIRSGAEIAGDLRPDVWPVEIHTNHGVAYASMGNKLSRLGDGFDLGEPAGGLVGIDATGWPIVTARTQLLRWSKSGGWRVLFDSAGGRQAGLGRLGAAPP